MKAKILILPIVVLLSARKALCNNARYLVRAQSVSRTELNAYLLTNPAAESIVEKLKNQTVSSSGLKSLRRQFQNAQLQYLQGQDSQMRGAWLNLVSYAYKADWPKPYRKMISMGFLRLAQISMSATETRKWLRFAANYDSSFRPDSQLFPPPLIAKFRQIRAEKKRLEVPTANFLGFDLVLVNGTPLQLAHRSYIKIPDQTVRLTFISSLFQTVSRVMPARVALQFKPRRLPWVSGSCHSPLWNAPLARAALFTDTCLAVRKQTRSVSWGSPSITSHVPSAPSSATPFYKQGWFWVTASAVTGAIIYAETQSPGPSRQAPTHTTGF